MANLYMQEDKFGGEGKAMKDVKVKMRPVSEMLVCSIDIFGKF